MKIPDENIEYVGEYIVRKDDSVGYTRFYVILRNSQGTPVEVEIEESLYSTLIDFSRQDMRMAKEYCRHIEHSELSEEVMNRRALDKGGGVEDEVLRNIQNELLHKAIAVLPVVQQRRVRLYFFVGLTYEQIGEMEGCSHVAVMKSVKAALKKIQKNLAE